MIERFEALLIEAGYEIVEVNTNGDFFTYLLADELEPEPLEVVINRDFIEDEPANGLAFVRMMFQRRDRL
jgi:hypothetical protein